MKIKASGRSALILATGLFVCFAAPLQTMAASADSAATILKSDGATAGNAVKPSTRHWKRSAQRKATSKSDETRKADVADAAGNTTAAIPASVANANAQLTSADAPADSTWAMSAKASTMLVAATDRPADAQAAPDAELVASDELNDVDRALQQSPPPSTQTVAMANAKAAPAARVLASGSDSSTWDQTSLIGKIFIAFGALLTMASAARMFIA